MGMLAALNHVTHYRYDRPIALGMQTIRLRPAPHTRSPVQAYSLKITPAEHFINWQQDPFGNYLAQVIFPEKVKEFRVEVDALVEIRVFNPFDFFLEEYARSFPFAYEPLLEAELAPYLEIKETGAQLLALLATIDRAPVSIIDFLVTVNQAIHHALTYVTRMEPGVQSCEETLALRSGSCRDMAWLLCQLLRHLGFATRFASGYLIQLTPDVKPLDGPAGTAVDFTDLHAWAEVYLPGAGWVGLDATSGLFAGEGHVPLCCTPNPSSAAPVSGTLEACESTLTHTMSITRIAEQARITKPFSDAQWAAIDALGTAVDKALTRQDVRLTMGGEPTFVSDTDRSGEAWHFTALSEDKKTLGNALHLRLRERFATGGLLHYAQGKWYPGEELPRWAMHCFWRRDGEPVWAHDALLANPQIDLGHDLKTAETFITELARRLAIADRFVIPAHADKAVAGYVLPLHFSYTRKGWISNGWQFDAGALVLIAGDSPLGLRLPLNSLPQVPPEEHYPERSAQAQSKALPSHAALLKKHQKTPSENTAFAKDPNGLIRSALCAQVRGGVLHVFLPPLSYIEHFLELVAAIETVASALDLPLVLEGYAPPADLRLRAFSVTPDPGVIEVNVQPAGSWDELKIITTTVYEEARATALSAEKFLLDGRRVGTGGGNHIVLGAASPLDSPFLRRPDLLQSLITFWQHHPSLSYLFSAMYIGPTSQAPRIDEARHDTLYELEIAFRQMPSASEKKPWLVDRLLRNLLVDLTGNTHRAEFCIDKLHSPDSERGRLGLLEMRGFEMTPHPRMNLLQGLLIRACIAHFWKTPYHKPLIRWGTQLHDRFMMPHHVQADFDAVLAELKSGGYDFSPAWFAPFFAFRFPEYGSVQIGEVTLELRMALEPWPVMGEEMNAGSVSRSVDSSVERLQVLVRGLSDLRHIVTCNGKRLPLKATAEHGCYVAAVRYKAWAPYSSLHPQIPVHTPLVFDVIDAHHGRSLGGCTYHVMHPGGRSYETIPVNENEAEGRRLSRFEPMGHTPGNVAVPPLVVNPEFPHTLDLRCFD
ncbi:MAG: transglutaminase family protein [Pseudomonadota bacterium]